MFHFFLYLICVSVVLVALIFLFKFTHDVAAQSANRLHYCECKRFKGIIFTYKKNHDLTKLRSTRRTGL
jgi:hypothetical protein